MVDAESATPNFTLAGRTSSLSLDVSNVYYLLCDVMYSSAVISTCLLIAKRLCEILDDM